MDINYGTVFGKFMDGIASAFDGENKGKTIEESIKMYKTKIAMINTFGNGNKGKFDKYAYNMFITGTMRKNWDLALLN